jgi:hypothetical protein
MAMQFAIETTAEVRPCLRQESIEGQVLTSHAYQVNHAIPKNSNNHWTIFQSVKIDAFVYRQGYLNWQRMMATEQKHQNCTYQSHRTPITHR